MAPVGFQARNHPQQTRFTGSEVSTDDRATVAEVFAPLDAEFGPFTVDVAAAAHNSKCERFYDVRADGLGVSWASETVWCNPPYSNIGPWVRKAWHETHRSTCDRVVMLLPANRTEQKWWQELVEPYRDRPGSMMSTRFMAGRPRFLAPGETEIQADARPPFGCVIVVIDSGTEASPCPPVATLFEVNR